MEPQNFDGCFCMYDSPPLETGVASVNSRGQYIHAKPQQQLSFYEKQMFSADAQLNKNFHLKQLKSKELILLSRQEIDLGGAKDLKHKIKMIEELLELSEREDVALALVSSVLQSTSRSKDRRPHVLVQVSE